MAQVAVIVDASAARGASFQQHLASETHLEVALIESGERLQRNIANRVGPQPDVVLYVLDENAPDVIRALKRHRHDIQIIALVDHAQVDRGMGAISAGASNLLLMPVHPTQLTLSVLNALAQRDLQMAAHQTYAGPRVELEDLEAQSPALQAALFLARRVSESDAAVVIEGPAGAGRELLARAIHAASERREHPFVVFNASAVPSKTLTESLFGSRKQEGVIKRVGEGTLFLRNATTLPDAIRKRLVTTFNSAGKNKRFSGRLLLAADDTTRRATAKEKRAMQEFYSQLNALPINLPALKEMREDIPTFIWLFCNHFATVEGKTIQKIAPEAIQVLTEMSWPGNLEQLSRVVFQAVMCCDGPELKAADFHHLKDRPVAKVAYLEGAGGEVAPSEGILSCMDSMGNIRRLQDVEQDFIHYALERYSGHVSEVARCLGIGRSTLYRKLAGKEGEES